MASLVGILIGICIGWGWAVYRASDVLLKRLDNDAPDEVVDVAEELFWRLVPWPVNKWLARRAERKVGR